MHDAPRRRHEVREHHPAVGGRGLAVRFRPPPARLAAELNRRPPNEKQQFATRHEDLCPDPDEPADDPQEPNPDVVDP